MPRIAPVPPWLSLALALGATACGSGTAETPGEVGVFEDGGAGAFATGDGGAPGPLDASIEQDGIQVHVVTLSCSGDCVLLKATATGGNPPYHFAWEDGTTTAARSVCPTSDAQFAVTVTDTARSGELARPAETAQASLAADVLACPDGGALEGDGGLCIANPSFEGPPASPAYMSGLETPPWVDCSEEVDGGGANTGAAVPSGDFVTTGLCVASPSATDGAGYLLLLGDGSPGVGFAEPLCAPMHAGVTYHFRADLMSIVNTCGALGPMSLEVFGSNSLCDPGALLGSTAPAGPSWSTYCLTITPGAETAYLGLHANPLADAGTGIGELLVDHLVPVDACP